MRLSLSSLLHWVSKKRTNRFEIRNVDKKKQTYMKTETCKLYSRVFWIFLPDIIRIDLYRLILSCTVLKLLRFLRHSVHN